MKPNFALDLSHEGINLLHRAKGGWSLVGSVALDDPDMAARLEDLRRKAAMLESGGFTTKLIIPNSQILYATVDAPGPDDIAREVQIRNALDGMTPYAVGDLVFDWRAEGDKARVAVLARETMDEAEAFASEYKFNPVSFVARPERGDFSGEPFFGKTRAATRLLEPGARVVPDASPVPRNPRAVELPPDARVDTGSRAEAEVRAPVVEADSAPASAEAPAETPTPPREDTQPPKSKPKPKRRAKPDADIRVSAPALAPFPPTPDEADEAATPVPQPLPPGAADTAPDAPEAKSSEPATAPLRPSPAADERLAKDRAGPASPETPPAAFQTTRATTPLVADDAPSTDRLRNMAARIAVPLEPEAGPAFGEGGAGATPPLAPEGRAKPAPRTGPKLETPAAADRSLGDRRRSDMADALARPLPSPDKPFERGSPVSGFFGGLLGAARGVSKRAGTGLKAAARSDRDAPETAKPQAQAGTGNKAALAATPDVSPAQAPETAAPETPRRGGLAALKRREKPAPPAEPAPAAKPEAEAFTVFGARQSKDTGGKPKYLGLILTLLLLLAMAIVAIWSNLVVGTDEPTLFNPAPSEDIASNPIPDETPAPAPDTEPQPQPQTPPPAAPVEPPATSAEVLSPEAAEARYAATGIWQRAPEPVPDPGSNRLESIDVAALTPVAPDRAPAPRPQDLPGQLRDSLLASPVPPPPPGTSFDLDENGLVRPTPEGALSPTGILVFAGRPPVVPPPRPGNLPAEAPPFALPGIPNTRPLPRPADLVTTPTPAPVPAPAPAPAPTPEPAPADAPATDDNAALTSDDEAAGNVAVAAAPRPAPRPGDIVVSTSSPNAAIDAAVEDALDAALVDVTELAVATSRLPNERPSNFAKIVDAARSAASDGSTVIAAAAPAAPSIPTNANVATRATMRDALNLREVNLIGIYGTSTARRALVRLKNGRYVKVKVGDRLEGGTVTSITASELTYQRGSRVHKLAVLPLG